MMGCLPGRRTLWAGLALATLAGAAGCVKDESLFLLDPEGPPTVRAAFVDVEEDPTYPVSVVFADFYSGHALTYGTHPDINNNEPVEPAEAVTLDSPVRVIFKELIRGRTMEQFKCACWNPDGDGVLAADELGCDNSDSDVRYSDSPDVNACTGCPDDPETLQNEADKCEDADQNGTPDDSVLKAGLATVSCTGTGFTTQTSDEDSGDYQPSGSLVIPADDLVGGSSIDGLGPAFRFHPGFHYPSSSTCTLVVNPNSTTITDKDDQPLAATSIVFNTTVTRNAATTVIPKAANVAGAPPTQPPAPMPGVGRAFTVTFTGDMDKTPANLNLITLACTGGTGGGTFAPTTKGNSTQIVLESEANTGYGFGKTCTLTIGAGLKDKWGNVVEISDFDSMTMGAQRAFTFTTGPAPAKN